MPWRRLRLLDSWRFTAPSAAFHALILVLPGLFERRTDRTPAAHAPALAHLLAIAGPPAREDGGTAAALAARYGVIRQTDWPLAPIRLAALGVDPEPRTGSRPTP
jgi:hypothetical protein